MATSETAHAHFTAKLCLVMFNVARIVQKSVVFGFTVYENDNYIQPAVINGTVITRYVPRYPLSLLVFTLMMFIGVHMLGVIGAIKENRRCLCSYGTILLFVNLLSLFAPMPLNPALFIIYMVMIVLAFGYSVMLKQREDHLRLYSPRTVQSA